MNVLVTGGAGFIGANLVRVLVDKGYRVRVLDNLSTGCREYLDGLDLEILEGDILDTEAVAQAVDGVDGVVHLAAQTGVPGSLEDPYHDCETNVIGTLNLLEACRKAAEGETGRQGEGDPLRRSVRIRFLQCAIGPPGTARHRGQGPPAHRALRRQQAGRRRVLPGLSRIVGVGHGGAALCQRLRAVFSPQEQYSTTT